jgi:prepilin-type N-terminal cleavage/methylation domain-containing protein
MTPRNRQDGFTLIEVLLVVTLIGIVASIALPVVCRARAAANEATTIESIRALNTAQVSYATSCAGGFYAPSITWLATPSTGTAAFVGPEFTADSVDRDGYTINFTAGPVATTALKTCNGVAAGQAVQSYFIGADPLQIGASFGVRHFGTNSSATIYQSLVRVSAIYSGAPPAPAKPIQ